MFVEHKLRNGAWCTLKHEVATSLAYGLCLIIQRGHAACTKIRTNRLQPRRTPSTLLQGMRIVVKNKAWQLWRSAPITGMSSPTKTAMSKDDPRAMLPPPVPTTSKPDNSKILQPEFAALVHCLKVYIIAPNLSVYLTLQIGRYHQNWTDI